MPHTRAKAVAQFSDVPDARVESVDLSAGEAIAPPEPVVEPAHYRSSFTTDLPEKFRDWRPMVATVRDARIVSAGAGVVDSRGLLVKQSLWDEEHYRRSFRRRLPAGDASYPGRATSICTIWDDNYYHWLIDALPRLGVLEATGRKITDVPVVVPAQLSTFQAQSLTALGITAEQQIPYDHRSLRLGELVWASAAAPIAHCQPFIPHWLRSKFVGLDARPSRRLYISRKVRKVANEDALRPVLDRFEFEVISPEGMSFTDQANLFASATMVVGAHGAGMANVAFGRGLRVLEIFQPGYVNTSPYAVSQAAGHAYWALVGARTGSSNDAKNMDIYLDPRLLDVTIRHMVES